MKIVKETLAMESQTIVLHDDETGYGMISIIIGDMKFRIQETGDGYGSRFLDINLTAHQGSDELFVLPRSANVVYLTAEVEKVSK